MPTKATKKVTGMIIRNRKPVLKDTFMTVSPSFLNSTTAYDFHSVLY